MKELNRLKEFIDSVKNVYVYGAGLIGNRVMQYVTFYAPEKIKGFVVSKKLDNCKDNTIYEISEITPSEKDGVIVAMQQIPFEVKANSFKYFDNNILFIYPRLNTALLRWQKKCLCEKYNIHKNRELIYEKNMEPGSVILMERGEKRFRIYELEKEEQLEELKKCSVTIFEEEYGKLNILSSTDSIEMFKEKRIELYVVTSHLDKMEVAVVRKNKYLIPIQVGAALTNERKDCISDDIGDNISHKNRDYCEITALYWIWKNTKMQDYVGIEHYRRRMCVDERIESLLCKYDIDVLAPIPQFAFMKNREFIFRSLVTQSDWENVKRHILEYDREFVSVVDKYEKSQFYFSCNICLMKRAIFDDYCKFAFTIADNIEKTYKIKNIIRQDDRYMGFIFEHLLSMYLMKNYSKLNIYCTNLEWCD